MTEHSRILHQQQAAPLALLHPAPVPTVAVIGLGYVGAVTCGCLSDLGFRVIGVDIDAARAARVASGRAPMHEAELDDLLAEGIAEGRLSATTDLDAAVAAADVTFVSVGTPSHPEGGCDTRQVAAAAESIGRALRDQTRFHCVVLRSSVPPGTTEGLFARRLEAASGKRAGRDFGLAFCPEFLREGSAVADFRTPPKTVIGASDPRSAETVARIFRAVDTAPVTTDTATAEMLKYVDNVWHATKVCFANEVGRLAARQGIDGREVMEIFCRDRVLNISPAYLRPGFAYGGSCLPKEVRSVCALAETVGEDLPLIGAIAASNDRHVEAIAERVRGYGLPRVGLLGLAFKAGTDDLRESASLSLARRLMGEGFSVSGHDPVLSPQLVAPGSCVRAQPGSNRLPRALHGIALYGDVQDQAAACDLLVVTQSNPEYRRVSAGFAGPVVDVSVAPRAA